MFAVESRGLLCAHEQQLTFAVGGVKWGDRALPSVKANVNEILY